MQLGEAEEDIGQATGDIKQRGGGIGRGVGAKQSGSVRRRSLRDCLVLPSIRPRSQIRCSTCAGDRFSSLTGANTTTQRSGNPPSAVPVHAHSRRVTVKLPLGVGPAVQPRGSSTPRSPKSKQSSRFPQSLHVNPPRENAVRPLWSPLWHSKTRLAAGQVTPQKQNHIEEYIIKKI